MIETYLMGSIGQLLERIRQLRQIVQGPYRREYDGLRQICLTHLDTTRKLFSASMRRRLSTQYYRLLDV